MRVVVASPVPLGFVFGGLEIQVLRTAEALRQLGVEIQFLDPWQREIEADLLHCFGSEYQHGELVAYAHARRIPIVVSSVFAPRVHRRWYPVWRCLDPWLPLQTTFRIRGTILRTARAVIALTPAEADDVEGFFGVRRERIHVIGNGVDDRFRTARPDAFLSQYGVTDTVLVAGNLHPLKNQLRLLRAVAGTEMPVVLLGSADQRALEYSVQVDREVERSGHAHLIPGLPYESPLLPAAFAAAHVVALPTLVDVQPLVMLEAAAAGANLVLSDLPGLRASFGDRAWYCDPRSADSIRQTICDAYRTPRGQRLEQPPPCLLSWREIAERLHAVYRTVLSE